MIPRVIHQVWVHKPMPDEVRRWIETWDVRHPGWTHVLWRDDDLRWLDNVALFDHADAYVADHAVGQMKADVARYEILAKFGGVYVDCDFECRYPIDDLVDVPAFAVRQPTGGQPANGLIGVQPGNAVMRECVARLPSRAMKMRGKSANRVSGPAFFGSLVRDDPDFTIYPADWFFAYSWADVQRGDPEYDPDGRYAVHHWLHRRQMYDRPLPCC